MTMKKFPIPPGVDRQGTKHSIGPRWYESNNMRFRDEYPETIGGWVDDEGHTLQGFGRGIHSWVDFEDNQYICVGTNFKFYVLVGANRYDITPVRLKRIGGTALTNPISTTSGSSVVTVTDAGHGAILNDFVVFTAVGASVGGLVDTDFLSVDEGFQILEIVDGDNYKIDVSVLATSTVSGGGGTVTLDYKVPSGSASDTSGSGYGVGLYGGDTLIPTEFPLNPGINVETIASIPYVYFDTTSSGVTVVAEDYLYVTGLSGTLDGIDLTYFNNKWWRVVGMVPANKALVQGIEIATVGGIAGGSGGVFYHDDVSLGGVVGASRGWGDASSASTLVDALRTVTIQNFGEDLMFCNRGGPIYYYDTSANVTSGVPATNGPAIVIDDTIGGSTDPIVACDSFIVSKDHGHTIAFAANDIGALLQNNMLIRWGDRHNPFVWGPTPDNEAGGRVLREGSILYGGIQTKNEILVFTNSAVYSMRYVGYPETYGFDIITRNSGVYSRGSFVAVDNAVFFMGRDQFYVYDGSVKPLSKNLVNHVFDDINDSQKDKCFSGVNSKFTEVIWFYPSADSFEPNKWVSYNLSNDTWTYGNFDMSELSSSGGTDSNARTSWHDVSVFNRPIASFVKGYDPESLPALFTSGIMSHESGRDANGMSISHSIKTGKMDISEGEMFVHYSRILPDVELVDRADTAVSPVVTLQIDGQDLPGRDETNSASVVLDFSANATPGLNYTPGENATAIRGRARTISFSASSNSSGYGWRLGTLRLDLKPDGRRS